MKTKKTALFSLYDTAGSETFARRLVKLGWRITATSETAAHLRKHKIKSVEIGRFLGVRKKYPFPPTLHPEMELLLTGSGGRRIDLVYDMTYPAASGIDIGGSTLLALAAKGSRPAAFSAEMMEEVVSALETGVREDEISAATSAAVFEQLSLFYERLSERSESGKLLKLMNGENPYQVPAYLHRFRCSDPLSAVNLNKIAGNTPCFTNIADLDSVITVISALNEALKKNRIIKPFIAVAAKHGNPCGIGVSLSCGIEALKAALWGSPQAVWGGELAVNFNIGTIEAETIKSDPVRGRKLGSNFWMLDIVAAPSFSPEAFAILDNGGSRKLFACRGLKNPLLNKKQRQRRDIRGGYLTQPPHSFIPVVGGPYTIPLLIAWASSWFSFHGGNEVAIASGNRLLSTGGGPSTVMAAQTAVLRARGLGHKIKGAVFAADAFFPFKDAPEILVKAGCRAGLVPSGGRRFNDVKKYFSSKSVKMLYLSEKYRGFFRH